VAAQSEVAAQCAHLSLRRRQGLLLAKKIYKNSDREQYEREAYLQEVEILKLLIRKPH
jgi:hypothetical protein